MRLATVLFVLLLIPFLPALADEGDSVKEKPKGADEGGGRIGGPGHGQGRLGGADPQAIDTDKDGTVTKTEWAAFFEKADKNGDGELDKDEWTAATTGRKLRGPAPRNGLLDTLVERGVRVPMRDGVNLGATIFRPKDAQPLPVIIYFTPYLAKSFARRAQWFARRGYVVATLDVRGRGNSEGKYEPFVSEGRDGHDLVEWLARQPWANGKVAMIGGSYTGWDQWSTVKEFPPHLETIVPVACTFPGTAGMPRNRNINLPYVMHWLDTVGRVSIRRPLVRRKYEMYRQHRAYCTFDKICGGESTDFQTWVKHPVPDAYWDAMNPTPEDYARIDKPVMTITGYFDAGQLGTMTHYRRLMQHASLENRKKHYLVIGPWDHRGAQRSKTKSAGLTFDKACLIDNDELHKQWYDWTLKDGKRPEFLKKNVAYYVMAAEKWKYADSLDALGTRPVRLYLDSSGEGVDPGKLSKELPRLSTSDKYTYDPLDTRPGELEMKQGGERNSYNIMYTSANSQRYATSVKRFKNGLIYHSEPFLEDTELTGYLKLVAWISMDVPDTDFMVTVHEVLSDGTSIQFTDDALRARYRNSSRKEKLVTPGKITRYEFKQFCFFSREIAKGSRLRVVFWSPNSMHLEKNYNGGGVVAEESGRDARTAHITLHHDAEHPSYLEIPVADR